MGGFGILKLMNMKNITSRCLRRGVLPLLPARCRLPFKLWLHLRHEKPEAELAYLDRLTTRQDVAIDAGANIGLYSLRMSRIFKKVYAFEINDEASRDLKDCDLPNVKIFDVGLSNRAGQAKLYIPVPTHGPQLNAWASLEPDNCPGVKRQREKNVAVRPLDDFQINDCSFLKIDVEGHELSLLEGAVTTIQRGRPVILIEVREQNQSQVCALFESLGYLKADLKQLVGITGSKGNFIFLPT